MKKILDKCPRALYVLVLVVVLMFIGCGDVGEADVRAMGDGYYHIKVYSGTLKLAEFHRVSESDYRMYSTGNLDVRIDGEWYYYRGNFSIEPEH